MTDWSRLNDAYGPAGNIPVLLDQISGGSSTDTWSELWSRLTYDADTAFPASFAVLPHLASIAQTGGDQDRDEALLLAATIMMTLHRRHEDDDIVWSNRAAIATLRRLAEARLATGVPRDTFLDYYRAALAFGGFDLWSITSYDFTDECYEVGCPHCAARVTVVIGDYGHYSSIRDWHLGDVDRIPLRPVHPKQLQGVRRWMHDTAADQGHADLASGLTYLFGQAECGSCGSVFNVADRYATENSPTQPIEPVDSATSW
jgi:hypothetical protein